MNLLMMIDLFNQKGNILIMKRKNPFNHKENISHMMMTGLLEEKVLMTLLMNVLLEEKEVMEYKMMKGQ